MSVMIIVSNRIVFESRTVLESELEDICSEDHTSLDNSPFLPSFNKKPSPFATSKTMFETSEKGKVCYCIVVVIFSVCVRVCVCACVSVCLCICLSVGVCV